MDFISYTKSFQSDITKDKNLFFQFLVSIGAKIYASSCCSIILSTDHIKNISSV